MQDNSLSAAVEIAEKAGVSVSKQDSQYTGEDKEKKVTLSSLFGENKAAMDLFLAVCFMIQRINTGGVNIKELEALDAIKNKLVESHQLAPGTLEFIIAAINNNADMYRLFTKGSPEFQYVQRQLPVDYCEIMANNLSKNPGLLLKVQLTGDVEKDLKAVQSILNTFLTLHTTDILSVSSKDFSFEPINPWQVIHNNLKGKLSVPQNTVIIAFQHREGQARSYFAIKSLVTMKKWLLRRLIEEEGVKEDVGVKERPTMQDEMLDRNAFLGINPNFISFSGNRPYSSKAPNSRVVEISDVLEDDYDHEDSEVLAVEAVSTTSGVKGLFGKTKGIMGLFNRRSEQKSEAGVSEVTEVEEHYGYHISLIDYNGDINTYFDLVWTVIAENEQELLLQDIYKQIFAGCTQASLSPIKVNVKNSIRGHWQDAAQGYLMTVDYSIIRPE